MFTKSDLTLAPRSPQTYHVALNNATVGSAETRGSIYVFCPVAQQLTWFRCKKLPRTHVPPDHMRTLRPLIFRCQVLQVIAGVCPCEGVREGSLPGDLRGRFGSYVTRAVRGRSAGHAHELLALGVIHGFQGEATSTLHAVDGGEGQEHVLWSTKCICFEKAVIKTPVLCAACCQSRASYVRWSKQQDQPYKPNAPNPTLSTPVKVFLCPRCSMYIEYELQT